ncbi:MAG: DUF4332 domain-containing protein [Actinomycetota bacterium]
MTDRPNDITTLPVQTLEGIGPTLASILADGEIHTVADLRALPASFIGQVLAGVASAAQVHRWRAMALLLQVPGMTPQWAEALVDGGVDEFDDLLRRDHDELTTLFDAARTAGTIPAAPTAGELLELVKATAWLHHMASVRGVVIDPAGDPLPGAEVSIGEAETTTNVGGHWLIHGLDAGRPGRLVVSADGFADQVIDRVEADNDSLAVPFVSVTLTPGPADPIVLDEYDGAELPLVPTRHEVERLEADALRPAELLVVQYLFKDGRSARLISVFRSMVRNRTVTRAYSVPLDRLPGPVEVGRYYRYRNERFEPMDLTPYTVGVARQRHQRLARLQRDPGWATAQPEERLARLLGGRPVEPTA